MGLRGSKSKSDAKQPLLPSFSNDSLRGASLQSSTDQNYNTFSEDDLLLALSQYYLVLKRANDIKYNVKKYILLTAVAGTSVWLYGTTGGLAAGSDITLKFLLITGGTVLNFFTTFNTSEIYLKYIKDNQIPIELQRFLKSQSNKVELFAIGGVAFISAGTVTVAVFSSAAKITWLVITEAFVTQIDNSFLHTFPVLLIKEVPILKAIFSLPVLPVILCYWLYRTIERHCFLSKEEIYIRKTLQVQQRNHQKIKNNMVETLEVARQQILNQTFKPQWTWKKPWNFKYNTALPANLKSTSNQQGLEYLFNIVSYSSHIETVDQISLTAKIKNFFVDTVIGNAFYLFGVGLSNLGSIGFYKNAYDDMVDVGAYYEKHLSGNQNGFDAADAEAWGWGLSALPNALIIIIIGYFAGQLFRNTLYDSFVACLRGAYQAPSGFKRYPKTVTLFIGVAFFLAKYGYGTAYYLVEESFKDAKFDDIRPTFLLCAQYGLPVFLFKNTIDFILNQANKYAQFFGGDDNKASAELDSKIIELENAIKNADGVELEESLKKISSEQRNKLLRMTEEEFEKLTNRSHDDSMQHSVNI